MPVDSRAILIKRGTRNVDPLVDTVLSEPESKAADLYVKALTLYKAPTKKPYIEACLLASENIQEISDLLEIDAEVLGTYAEIFYDLKGLDKLSKLDLLNVTNKQEALLKIWAFSQGLDFIAWRLGRHVNISPVQGLQELFTTCIMKSKEAMFSGNASEESKEATKWVKLSLDLARLLKAWVMDNDAAKADIQMALREVVPNFDGFDSLDDFNESPTTESAVEQE